MNAGPMRQRVTLQSLVETRDTLGQPGESWLTVGTYWAEVITYGGAEGVNAGQVQADATHTVKLRYDSSRRIDPTMRVSFAGKVFGIVTSKDPVDFRNRETRLMCREIVGLPS